MSLINRMPSLVVSAALIASMDTPASVEAAASVTQPQESTAPHADLREVCRRADQQLQDMLGFMAHIDGTRGVIDVTFDIEGERIQNVRISNGPAAYCQATKRAVYRLECSATGAGRQSVRMQVAFLGQEGAR